MGRRAKYFSLSDKYERWKAFATPARGVGVHALVVAENEALRLSAAELEQHPGWKNYAGLAAEHPPLRGLLAVPLVGEDGLNYGLLQASDKVEGGDFDASDEARMRCLARLSGVAVDALRKVHDLRAGIAAPVNVLAREARFVAIEMP